MNEKLIRELHELEIFHWWHRAKRGMVHRLRRRYMPDREGCRVLNLGCGGGLLEAELKRDGLSPVSVDLSPVALRQTLHGQIPGVQADCSGALPFADDSFDAVFALDIVEHLDDDRGCVEDVFRVLRPGGMLLVTVPAFAWLWSQWDVELGHRRRYRRKRLKGLLTTAGFEVRWSSYFFGWLSLPALAIRKTKSLFRRSYRSDFRVGPRALNPVLLALSRFDLWLARTIGLPIGTSLGAVGLKPRLIGAKIPARSKTSMKQSRGLALVEAIRALSADDHGASPVTAR